MYGLKSAINFLYSVDLNEYSLNALNKSFLPTIFLFLFKYSISIDVNSLYFEENGGYEFAKKFYEKAYNFAEQEMGSENILSAVLHADEINTALTEEFGREIYHYHLHVIAIPVVKKEIKYSKRCKDKSLVGTTKEIINQVSHSKKWKSESSK